MVCSKCGNNISRYAQYCPACGNPIKETYLLTIIRKRNLSMSAPVMTIFVDGTQRYKLYNNTTINIPVSSGEHIIGITCKKRNKTIKVSVFENMLVRVKWRTFLGIFSVKKVPLSSVEDMTCITSGNVAESKPETEGN